MKPLTPKRLRLERRADAFRCYLCRVCAGCGISFHRAAKDAAVKL